MRRINKFGYLLVFIIPLFIALFLINKVDYFLIVLPVLIFILLPLIDPIIGTDDGNFDVHQEKIESEDKYYKYIMYAWAIAQSLVMLAIVYYFTSVRPNSMQLILLLLNAMIMNGGVGIVVAHELGHKNNKLDKFLAKLLLIQVAYGHFTVEHNRGHHVNVGTELDPATGRYNQSYYSFWYQSVIGGFKHALKLESDYLTLKKKKNTILTNEVYNSILWTSLIFIITVLIVYFIKPESTVHFLIFIILQAVLSFSLLEAVNYIEHYAIIRKQSQSNNYEKINPTHSWNANYILSNYLLFQLQRHSDHHLYSTKNYQILKQYKESPQLPNGYPGMVLLSLVPPIWKRIMNKRLHNWMKIHEGTQFID